MAKFNGVRVCKMCHKEYMAVSGSQKYCSACAQIRKKELDKALRQKRRDRLKKLRARSTPSKTINEIVGEVLAYNKKHGTHLTYGQYVGKMTLGLLKD